MGGGGRSDIELNFAFAEQSLRGENGRFKWKTPGFGIGCLATQPSHDRDITRVSSPDLFTTSGNLLHAQPCQTPAPNVHEIWPPITEHTYILLHMIL